MVAKPQSGWKRCGEPICCGGSGSLTGPDRWGRRGISPAAASRAAGVDVLSVPAANSKDNPTADITKMDKRQRNGSDKWARAAKKDHSDSLQLGLFLCPQVFTLVLLPRNIFTFRKKSDCTGFKKRLYVTA